MTKMRKCTRYEYFEATGLASFWITEECAPTMLVIERYERLGSFAMWSAGLILGVLIGWVLT